MTFRMTARTILQLGAELISSDGVAFYELIKNAFDAGSERVDLDLYARLDYDFYISRHDAIAHSIDISPSTLDYHKQEIIRSLHTSAPRVGRFADRIRSADSKQALLNRLEEANYILIKDTGHGMSYDDLREIYLTIGTRHRLKQREELMRARNRNEMAQPDPQPILGEKGLGRLSVMRLGWRIRVDTTMTGETNWNRLVVDWRSFADEDAMVEDVEISPSVGAIKSNSQLSGTQIRIYALTSAWSTEKLQRITREDFSKLTDPFVPDRQYSVNVRFNDEPVPIPRFDKVLFERAHASARAQYIIENDEPALTGKIDYKIAHRELTFALDTKDLLTITGLHSPELLLSLGPFSMEFYWYNRRILTAVESIGDRRAVQQLVNAWSGGLKVYRDGFRVNPYGSQSDDWLDLDHRALASPGYKVNRSQMIGVVRISSIHNPTLTDQTNREGLRETPEKGAMVEILRHIIEAQFRRFLNEVDKEAKRQEPASFDDLEERVEEQETILRENLTHLFDRYPEIRNDRSITAPIDEAIRRIRSLMTEASSLAESYRLGHSELTNLAGIGLMVEIVAHELNRATEHTLRVIADADRHRGGMASDDVLRTLEAQMQTLQRRLRVLDPLSTSGRQRKERFDVVDWVRQILSAHRAQFRRHGIHLMFSTPTGDRLRVLMVRGMLVQILENLIANSVYWLKKEMLWNNAFQPNIEVQVDVSGRLISFTDNGPGIPFDRKEEIFQPFFTTKPPGEGHGLGLYISKEIAEYNGVTLELSEQAAVHHDRLNTFLVILPQA